MEAFFLIIAICLIIVISPMVSKLLNAPVVVVEILLGVIAGYMGFIYENPYLILLAKFGFVYLMFLAGIEINFKLIKLIKAALAWNVIFYFISLYTISWFMCWVFDLGITYFIAFPIFSLGMLMMLIKEHGKEEPWLNLALSIGIVGEVVSILALTLFSGWIEYGFETEFFIS
ncbi:MAG: cation:proton antiporter, partial [Arcobacteraceae bacterium]